MIFDFAQPWLLLGLLLVPFVAWLTLRRRRNRSGVQFSAASLAAEVSGGRRSKGAYFLLVLRCVGLALLVVALARPRFGSETHETQSSGIDIMLAVDMSGSMLALDLSLDGQRATRLEVVKKVLSDFIDRRPNDRIGLVAFATEPYLVSPLTLEHEWLKQNLQRLNVGMIEAGTSIGPPVGVASNRLRLLDDSHSRIIVLLTDGKDSGQPKVSPLTYAEAASSLGIKLYTVAVGSTAQTVPTYAVRPDGELYRDYSGRPIIQQSHFPLDEQILSEMAEKGNGRYFRARNTSELEDIYKEIDKLEKTEVTLKMRMDYEDVFYWPLAAGLVFLVIERFLAYTRLRTLP